MKNKNVLVQLTFILMQSIKIKYNFFTSKLNLELNPLEKLYLTKNIRKRIIITVLK